MTGEMGWGVGAGGVVHIAYEYEIVLFVYLNRRQTDGSSSAPFILYQLLHLYGCNFAF